MTRTDVMKSRNNSINVVGTRCHRQCNQRLGVCSVHVPPSPDLSIFFACLTAVHVKICMTTKMWSMVLQESNGPWHLQGIEVLDKSSGRTFFFPCSHWLDTAGKARSKLQLGPRPPSPTPPLQPLAVPEEEEQWQPELREETAETVDRGVGGCYTVSPQES